MFFSHLGEEGKWLFGTAALIRDENGRLIGAIESWQDLTEHKRLEAQLIQTQKMEAIGTLAGGIAHDFSNILTAIAANAETVRRRESKKADISETLSNILTVCNHGKDLIHRLKMFHRPSESAMRPQRVDSIIQGAIDLARFTLPSSIQIHRHIDSQAQAAVDATQLQQVVMNLCANAAHAMKGKPGELTISLTDATEDENRTLVSGQNNGHTFIKLTVSDTGHGIPADILPRIFEPFFTTKPKDQGSGMGLSVSHGIIKSFGGHISVESRPGQGTDFFVYLPIHRASPTEDPGMAPTENRQ
jgi:signal transduction histidine kinase